MHLSVLELRAVRRTCRAFLSSVHSRHILVLSDNTTTIYYVNEQGDTRSTALWVETVRLWGWWITQKILL